MQVNIIFCDQPLSKGSRSLNLEDGITTRWSLEIMWTALSRVDKGFLLPILFQSKFLQISEKKKFIKARNLVARLVKYFSKFSHEKLLVTGWLCY